MNSKYKALIISGKGNVGKTASILLAADLIATHLSNSYQNVRIKGPNKYYDSGDSKDRWFVFETNNKRIGIISRGDSARAINEGFDLIGKCDYYICASHLYG